MVGQDLVRIQFGSHRASARAGEQPWWPAEGEGLPLVSPGSLHRVRGPFQMAEC